MSCLFKSFFTSHLVSENMKSVSQKLFREFSATATLAVPVVHYSVCPINQWSKIIGTFMIKSN